MGDRCVVIDKDVWSVRYWLSFKKSIDQEEDFAILIASWVQIFFVRSGELPVIEEDISMPLSSGVRFKPGGSTAATAFGSDQDSMFRKSAE